MGDAQKTKAELLKDVTSLRRKLQRLEKQQKPAPKKKTKNSTRTDKNQEHLREVIDILPDAVYMKDRKGRKLIANLSDIRNTGKRTLADVIGKTDFDLFPKEIAEQFHADDEMVMSTGQPVINREETFVDKAGRKQWLLTSKLPMWDDKGNVIGLVGIGRNISKRKAAELDAEKQRIEFQQLFENLPFAIALCDEEERILRINPAFRTIYQYTIEEVEGKRVNDVIVPPELKTEGDALTEKVSNDNVVTKETRRRRKDGSLVNVRLWGIPIRIDGVQTGYFAVYKIQE